MGKLVRLFAAIFATSLQRELAFRANLLFGVLLAAVGIASGLAALSIVYTRVTTLGGWSWADAVVLLGTYQIVSGLLATFVEPNMSWFGGQVKDGTLDNILLKPVSSVFLASLGRCAPLELGQVVLGLVVVGIGVGELGGAVTLANVAGWLLLIAVAIIVAWASRVLIASVALWSPGVELDVVYGAVWQFGRYPVSIYDRPVRFVLTYVLPVAFVSTIPARALTRGTTLPIVLAGLLVSGGALILVRLLWNAGLRRYTSATS